MKLDKAGKLYQRLKPEIEKAILSQDHEILKTLRRMMPSFEDAYHVVGIIIEIFEEVLEEIEGDPDGEADRPEAP